MKRSSSSSAAAAAAGSALSGSLPKRARMSSTPGGDAAAAAGEAFEKRLVSEATNVFSASKNAAVAEGQSKYMRNQFPFFGLKTPQRTELQKEILATVDGEKASQAELVAAVKLLWDQPEREFQHFGMGVAIRFLDFKDSKTVLDLAEHLITRKSWWDTVDCISPSIAGKALSLMNKKDSLARLNTWIDREWKNPPPLAPLLGRGLRCVERSC